MVDFGSPRACCGEHHQTLDNGRGDVHVGQPNHGPASERRLEVFLHVGDEARRAIVAPLDPDAALDLDERAAREVGEVGSPAPAQVEAIFALEGRTAEGFPVKGELSFKL